MASRPGRIVGHVTYVEGDGIAMVIRPGPCEIEATELDVTISWTEGATRGAAAIPLTTYKEFEASGAIKMEG